MEQKKLVGDVEVEKYPDGSMGVILSKQLVRRFDKVFKNKPVDIFVALAEKDGKMIIEIMLPKQTYVV